jgi:hypothetical protein
MEKVVQFIANYDEWRAVKKLKIDEKTDPRTVMEFLASLSMGLDAKVEENLGKVVELDKINSALGEIEYGKTEEEIAAALKAVNSRKVASAIKEASKKPGLQKNEQKELEQFCIVYATKKALKNCGMEIDYSNIKIPGLKRLKRTKV